MSTRVYDWKAMSVSPKTLSFTLLVIVTWQICMPMSPSYASTVFKQTDFITNRPTYESVVVRNDPDYDDPETSLDSEDEPRGHFEHPEDISLAPKLLLPKTGLDNRPMPETFDVLQPWNLNTIRDRNLLNSGQLSHRESFTAYIPSVPIDLTAVQIQERTPAEEFFHQVRVLSLSLGSIAIALLAFVLVRIRRKTQVDS